MSLHKPSSYLFLFRCLLLFAWFTLPTNLALAKDINTATQDTSLPHNPPPQTSPPQRVVALSWEATEYLLAIGVAPLAVADRQDYLQWVVKPALPPEVLDAGGRLEPNLEQLHQLAPDLIIINPSLQAMQPRLETIAPTLLLDSFRFNHDNEAAAYRIQRQIAQLFDKEAQLDALLRNSEQRYHQLKEQLRQHYPNGPPEVCIIRFASPTTLWIYGDNSMPLAALRRLGLSSNCPQPKTAWGITLRNISDLGRIKQGALLHFLSFAQMPKVTASPLWQALPMVRHHQVMGMRPTWTYGGPYSIQLLAEAITEALLAIQQTEN